MRIVHVIASLILGATALLRAQQSPPPARIVAVPVVAVDRTERPVDNLSMDQLRVEIDGQVTRIESLAAEGTTPLSVVFLIDQSASNDALRPPPFTRETSLVDGVMSGLLPALGSRDDLWLGRIVNGVRIQPLGARTREAVNALVGPIPPTVHFSGSPIWDAIDDASRTLVNAKGRRLVILVTDGKGTGNRLSVEEAAARAVDSQVAVDVILEGQAEAIKQEADRRLAVRPDRAPSWLAAATGGVLRLDASARGEHITGRAFGTRLSQCVETHRRVHWLRLGLPGDGHSHSLSLTTTQSGLRVSAPAFIPAAR